MAWNLLQQNLNSVLTYIKDSEEERKKTRENTYINANGSHTNERARS